MTNRIAIVLGILTLTAIAIDVAVFGADNLLFLSKKIMDLIEWLAFWR
ncbi:MAG: hypothetical protein AB8B58_03925 [Roseobacter sp.]